MMKRSGVMNGRVMMVKRSKAERAQRAENARAWGPIDGLEEPDRERQVRAVAEGAGNAVADLKAGFGTVPVPVPPGTSEVRVEDVKVVQPGRLEQAVERGRESAEAMGAAAPENILRRRWRLTLRRLCLRWGLVRRREYVPEGVWEWLPAMMGRWWICRTLRRKRCIGGSVVCGRSRGGV